MNAAKPYSPVSTAPPSTDSHACETMSTSNTTTLSVDFTTPLAGDQRQEAIKQMSQRHPAFEKTRSVQETLFKAQTSLRRMPGVSAGESGELISQLQEVGQIVSVETTKLVHALKSMELDSKDTDQAVQRMSLGANLMKAEVESKEAKIGELVQQLNYVTEQLESEKERRQLAEDDIRKDMEDFINLSRDFKAIKQKALSRNGSPAGRFEMIKGLENAFSNIEEHIKARHSYWLLQQQTRRPNSVSRAMESLTESVSSKDAALEGLESLSMTDSIWHHSHSSQQSQNGDIPRSFSMQELPRTPHGYQPIERPPTSVPARFESLHAGPPRAANGSSNHRGRPPGQAWGATNGDGRSQSRSASVNRSLPSNGSFNGPVNRASSRRGYQEKGRYRGNAPEFHLPQTSIFTPTNSRPSSRAGTAFGNNGIGQEFFPNPPMTPGRYHKPRRTAQQQLAQQVGYDGSDGAMANGQTIPLIHLTDLSVAAWQKQVSAFYNTIRDFVDKYAAIPVVNPQELIKTDLWHILIRTYLPLSQSEATSYLDFHLRDSNSKLCLVTRVIVDYIVNCVWSPGAWKGADNKTTAALSDLQIELAKAQGQTSAAKQPLLDRQAAVIDIIMKYQERGSNFYRSKIEEIAGTIVTNLRPLLNPNVETRDAYCALHQVAEQAWDLSSKILTSRLSFDFRFPEIGSRFSQQSMCPIWPTDLDAFELQARHWRVALVTTPVITARNDTGTNISAHSVANADVICMQ